MKRLSGGWKSIAFRALLLAGASATAARAADIAVTNTNDAGAGSFRNGILTAVQGDRLVFDAALNGQSISNGAAVNIPFDATLFDGNNINLSIPNEISSLNGGVNTELTVDWMGQLTLSGPITGGRLIKSGLGSVVLSGNNSYGGGTRIDNGTVRVESNSGLGTGALTVTNALGTPVLDIANGVNIANAIDLQSTLLLNADTGTTSTLSGIIGETGGSYRVTRVGGGTTVFSGANTFTGGLYLIDGRVRLENDLGLGTGLITMQGAGVIDLADGITAANAIDLQNNFSVNVDAGLATLSGNIGETGGPSRLTKTGAGILALTGTNTFSNGASIDAGGLQVNSESIHGDIDISAGAQLIFDQAGYGEYLDVITGAGDLRKIGANVIVFKNDVLNTGTTTIDVGEVQIRQQITSDIVVNANGVLSGEGQTRNVVNNGTVQVGNFGLGELTVNGTYTQGAAGKLEVDIQDTGSTPGIDNDSLVVNGVANIDGSLDVIAAPGTFTDGMTYTVLSATGGVNGQFSTITDNLTLFRVLATYNTNDVVIELERIVRLGEIGISSNERTVGVVLDDLALSGTAPLANLINDIGALSTADQQKVLAQLSGDMLASTQTISMQLGDQFQGAINNRLINNGSFLNSDYLELASAALEGGDVVRGQSPGGGLRGWAAGYGSSGDVDANGAATGYNLRQGGLAYGVDLGADENGAVGIAGGHSYASFSNDVAASGSVNTNQIGLYALKKSDALYVLGNVNYGYNDYSTNRVVGLNALNYTGSYNAHQFGAYGESGAQFGNSGLKVQPFVALQYLSVHQDGFTEFGGPGALTVSGNTADSLRSHLGTRLMFDPLTSKRAVWTPYVHARWVANLSGDDTVIAAAFNGVPVGGSFNVAGNTLGDHYGLFGGGLNCALSDRFSLYGNYDLQANDQFAIHTGTGGILYQW